MEPREVPAATERRFEEIAKELAGDAHAAAFRLKGAKLSIPLGGDGQ